MMAISGTSSRRADLPLRGAVVAFVLAACFLDVQLPSDSIKVGNLILVGGCVLATTLAILVRKRAGIRGVAVMSPDWVYLCYLVFVFLSALWSPSPLRTTVQAIYLTAVWITTMNIGDADAVTVNRTIVRAAVAVALLSFAVIPFESFAFQPRSSTGFPELRGIFSHQLRLGVFMAATLGLVVLAWLNGHLSAIIGRSGVKVALWVVVIVACLGAAVARLYTAAMIVALGMTIGLARPGWRRLISVLAIGTLVTAIVVSSETLVGALVDEGFDLTLTGRAYVWERTLRYSDIHPWLGYGYASFDHPSFDGIFPYWRPAHPHNSYLQAYFETGLIGLTLTLLFILLQLRIALRASRMLHRYSYSLFLVLLAAIGSITGSNYAGKPTLLLSLVMLMVAVEAREVRKVTRYGRSIDLVRGPRDLAAEFRYEGSRARLARG